MSTYSLSRKLSVAKSTPELENEVQEIYSMLANDYEVIAPIGMGSSATVFKALYRPLQKEVAIKVIDLDKFERNQIDELRKEIQIMSLNKHPNLLQVHCSFVTGSKLYIVTPFFSGGSCLDIMKTAFPQGIPEIVIASILKQTLQGLAYLHKNNLIHRDLKAGNILIDKDGGCGLADFGVSSSLMETGKRLSSRKTFVGTPCWMAPEVIEQSGYSTNADIWSFGITCLELANGQAPYCKFPPMKVLKMILVNDPPTLDRKNLKNKYSKSFQQLIQLCLNRDQSKRPSAETLLKHSFFKQAEKNRYIKEKLLDGLEKIENREHNKKIFVHSNPASSSISNERKPKTIDSWDFNEIEEEVKPRTVKFSIASIINSEEFKELDLKSDLNSTNEVVTDSPRRKSIFTLRSNSEGLDEEPTTTEEENNEEEGDEKNSNSNSGGGGKKSRFIIDSDGVETSKEDLEVEEICKGVEEVLAEEGGGGEGEAGETGGEGKEPKKEVKKGRFTVDQKSHNVLQKWSNYES